MSENTTTLRSAIEQLKMQTQLFLNVVDGVSEEHALERLAGRSNHFAWLVGHIVSTRFQMGYVLGMPMREPHPELFERGIGLNENATYPSLETLVEPWAEFSEKLLAKLEDINEDQLASEPPIVTPIGDYSLRGFISFLAHHEAYHIGQLGILRKALGYTAMRYA